MTELTVFELAWLVGIMEGEGYFGFLGGSQRIALKMTDEDVVKKAAKIMQKIIGKRVNVGFEDRTNVSDRHSKSCFIIALTGSSARMIMQTIVGHMGYRRRKRIWQSLNGFKEEKIDLVKLLKIGEPT